MSSPATKISADHGPAVRDRVAFEPRGEIDVKGKGPMRTCLLVDGPIPA